MTQSRYTKWVVLAILLILAAIPSVAAAQGGGGNPGRGNRLILQPVLIYTVSTGLTGTEAGEDLNVSTLIVYSNGMAIFAQADDDDDSGVFDDDEGDVQVAFVGTQQVNQLLRDLRRGGAFNFSGLTRQELQNNQDAAIATITIFQNAGNAPRSLALTFSFLVGDETSRGAQFGNMLQDFLSGNFNTNGGGGGGS